MDNSFPERAFTKEGALDLARALENSSRELEISQEDLVRVVDQLETSVGEWAELIRRSSRRERRRPTYEKIQARKAERQGWAASRKRANSGVGVRR